MRSSQDMFAFQMPLQRHSTHRNKCKLRRNTLGKQYRSGRSLNYTEKMCTNTYKYNAITERYITSLEAKIITILYKQLLN